jgi:hypothetical protein
VVKYHDFACQDWPSCLTISFSPGHVRQLFSCSPTARPTLYTFVDVFVVVVIVVVVVVVFVVVVVELLAIYA